MGFPCSCSAAAPAPAPAHRLLSSRRNSSQSDQTGNSFLLLDRTCRKHVQNVLSKSAFKMRFQNVLCGDSGGIPRDQEVYDNSSLSGRSDRPRDPPASNIRTQQPLPEAIFLEKNWHFKKPMKAIGPRRIPEPNRKIWDSTEGFRGDSGGIPRDSVWVCRDSMGFRVGRNYEFSHIWGVRNFPYYNIRSENARNTWVRVPVSGPFILCLQGSVSAPCIYCSRILLQIPGVCACAPRF